MNDFDYRVLFVCLGNICRSPTAEAVMRQRLVAAELDERIFVDSAGTGPWHVGEAPDRRAQAAAAERGYDLSALQARQVVAADLRSFDYVVAMDQANFEDLCALAGDQPTLVERIVMLGDFSPRYAGQSVGDPFYGGDDGFRRVFEMIETCIDGLIETIRVESTTR